MHANSQSGTWQDIAAFISLAAAAGLACGVALGGIALLLSAPAYGAETAGTLVLRPLEPELDPYAAIRLAPTSTEAGFRMDEGMAQARIVQTFRNPGSAFYDGIYAITLPQDATVQGLQVQVGEERLDIDPADFIADGVLALEIPDIGPLQTVTVELRYAMRTDPRRPKAAKLFLP